MDNDSRKSLHSQLKLIIDVYNKSLKYQTAFSTVTFFNWLLWNCWWETLSQTSCHSSLIIRIYHPPLHSFHWFPRYFSSLPPNKETLSILVGSIIPFFIIFTKSPSIASQPTTEKLSIILSIINNFCTSIFFKQWSRQEFRVFLWYLTAHWFLEHAFKFETVKLFLLRAELHLWSPWPTQLRLLHEWEH